MKTQSDYRQFREWLDRLQQAAQTSVKDYSPERVAQMLADIKQRLNDVEKIGTLDTE